MGQSLISSCCCGCNPPPTTTTSTSTSTSTTSTTSSTSTTSTSTTTLPPTTTSTTTTTQSPIFVGCNQDNQSGGAGTTTFTYPMNPAGGTFVSMVQPYDIPDSFALSIDGNVVSGSSMTLSNAASFGVPAGDIGDNLGLIPSRITEFLADVGTVPAGLASYRQLLWHTYTALDYTNSIDRALVLTITGAGTTLWQVNRFCTERDTTACQSYNEPYAGNCCDALVSDGGICTTSCADPLAIIVNGVCTTPPDCIANGSIGTNATCCSGVAIAGICSDCIANGGSSGGQAANCCSGLSDAGICVATLACSAGNTSSSTECIGNVMCTTTYISTGAPFTGGGVNIGGCEYVEESQVCQPDADGDGCP